MNKRGFTLIEFIIGMAAGVAIALVAMFLWAPVDNWMFTQARRSGVAEAETAVMRVVKEIHRVKSTGDITTFTGNQFQFTDVDDQDVNFHLQDGNLMRGGDILARNVQSLTFEYLDANGVVAAMKADIRVVRISLDLLSGGNPVRLRSAARVRNI